MRTSMNGCGWRAECTTRAAPPAAAPHTAHHAGRSLAIATAIAASSMAENSAIPTRSRPGSARAGRTVRGGSRGTHSRTRIAVASASGMLTVKIACQPKAPVRMPPRARPTAAVDCAASAR